MLAGLVIPRTPSSLSPHTATAKTRGAATVTATTDDNNIDDGGNESGSDGGDGSGDGDGDGDGNGEGMMDGCCVCRGCSVLFVLFPFSFECICIFALSFFVPFILLRCLCCVARWQGGAITRRGGGEVGGVRRRGKEEGGKEEGGRCLPPSRIITVIAPVDGENDGGDDDGEDGGDDGGDDGSDKCCDENGGDDCGGGGDGDGDGDGDGSSRDSDDGDYGIDVGRKWSTTARRSEEGRG